MRKTYYLIDGTVLSGEVIASYTNTVEIIDDDGNLWSLTRRNIVRICKGKAYADGGVNE